jgi:hypothetical protein
VISPVALLENYRFNGRVGGACCFSGHFRTPEFRLSLGGSVTL